MTLAGKSEKGAATERRAGRGRPADDAHHAARRRHAAAAAAGRGARRPRHGRARVAARASSSEYVALTKYGLNTIELDVKDEGGEIAFPPGRRPAGAQDRRRADVLQAREVARQAHRKGVYLIGRVVVFQDPYLAAARPDLAINEPDGGIWTTSAGPRAGSTRTTGASGTTPSRSPRPRREPASTRSCSTTSASPPTATSANAVYPGRTQRAEGRADRRASSRTRKQRLAPLGVRVSTALFGLSATRDMGIGQVPALDLAARRPRPPDGVPRALRRRGARDREPERRARRDRLPDARRLQASS